MMLNWIPPRPMVIVVKVPSQVGGVGNLVEEDKFQLIMTESWMMHNHSLGESYVEWSDDYVVRSDT
jgi:hypothetical protein